MLRAFKQASLSGEVDNVDDSALSLEDVLQHILEVGRRCFLLHPFCYLGQSQMLVVINLRVLCYLKPHVYRYVLCHSIIA